MQELGFGILATRGTAAHLEAAGLQNVEVVLKIQEGRPNAADLMKNKDIQMMMITSTGNEPDVRDGKNLRRLSLALKVRECPRCHTWAMIIEGGACQRYCCDAAVADGSVSAAFGIRLRGEREQGGLCILRQTSADTKLWKASSQASAYSLLHKVGQALIAWWLPAGPYHYHNCRCTSYNSSTQGAEGWASATSTSAGLLSKGCRAVTSRIQAE